MVELMDDRFRGYCVMKRGVTSKLEVVKGYKERVCRKRLIVPPL